MQPRLPDLALGPRYQILDTIASGGMGTVYLGRITGPGAARAVAVKVLHPHLAQDPENVALFLDEARIATRLHHPNVVDVTDVDMVGDELVIVMPYVEGLPLSRVLRILKEQKRQLSLGLSIRILHDALRGLHAAHELRDEQGGELSLVHRDVTPHNVLVGTDGSTRVTDFGVATSVGRLAFTHTHGGVRGKLQYLAPEQVYRRPLDRRVDVFAAGIVLWQCLTGRQLFDGGTEAETLAMILRDPIQPPSLDRADVPLELDEACLRALERDPGRRYATAEMFADALANLPSVRMAAPGDVGRLVEELAHETVERHRDLLRAAEAGAPRPLALAAESAAAPPAPESGRDVTALPPQRSSLQLLGIVAMSVVIGGGIVFLATPRPPSAPAPTAPTATQETTAAATASSPPSGSSAPSASSAAPADPPAADVEPSAGPVRHAILELPNDAPSRPHARPRSEDAGSAPHPRAGATAKPARPFMPNGL